MMLTRLIILLFHLFLLWNVDGVNGSGSEIPCCNSGNYTFHSFFDALNNITSNTIIKISTDVVLSSNVIIEDLNNITITGQGNPTVNCNGIGSVKCVSCNNVTIEGVNWEKCGSNNKPGIELYKSFSIVLDNTFFHHSIGPAFVLSKVSGNVCINNCQFTHNKYHKGHGAAIYYTSSPEQSTQVQLVINNCDFTMNGPTESVVYIDNLNNRADDHNSILQNCTFMQNQGVPIYISHTSLILNNNVSFKDNKATAGGGIYSSNSIIKFDDKCNVSFYNNSVNTNGGAIYQAHSKICFTMNAAVSFVSNHAAGGGAIGSYYNSSVIFDGHCIIIFSDNRATNLGGAISSIGSIYIISWKLSC